MCFWQVNILIGVPDCSAPPLGSPQTSQPGLRSCFPGEQHLKNRPCIEPMPNYEKREFTMLSTLALGVNGVVYGGWLLTSVRLKTSVTRSKLPEISLHALSRKKYSGTAFTRTMVKPKPPVEPVLSRALECNGGFILGLSG